jgi:hypothetical protein
MLAVSILPLCQLASLLCAVRPPKNCWWQQYNLALAPRPSNNMQPTTQALDANRSSCSRLSRSDWAKLLGRTESQASRNLGPTDGTALHGSEPSQKRLRLRVLKKQVRMLAVESGGGCHDV